MQPRVRLVARAFVVITLTFESVCFFARNFRGQAPPDKEPIRLFSKLAKNKNKNRELAACRPFLTIWGQVLFLVTSFLM